MLLYYITDRNAFSGTEALLRRIAAAARAGVDYIQLREKDLTPTQLEYLTNQAIQVVRQNSSHTKLLINTHAGIALALGADGVHLPAGSPPASDVRAAWLRQANREPLIGVSAHRVDDVSRARSECASFVLLAPIFEKVGMTTPGIGLDALREACAQSTLPILALGGVNLTNARACLNAGAAGIAGIRLFQQGDVAETVRQLRELEPAH